jgi:hypothetical protein
MSEAKSTDPVTTPLRWRAFQKAHTKGPPSTDPADAHLDYFHIEAGRAHVDGGWEISGYMRPGDARLIAAAPELLEALKAALPILRKATDGAVAWGNAYAAIDKAEGRA